MFAAIHSQTLKKPLQLGPLVGQSWKFSQTNDFGPPQE